MDAVSVLWVVATEVDRQNGQSVMATGSGVAWSPVNGARSGKRMIFSLSERTRVGLDERCPTGARTQESVTGVYGHRGGAARIIGRAGVCITTQTCTREHGTIVLRLEETASDVTHMLLIIGVLIMLTAVVIGSRLRVPGGVNPAKLGWMSDQWLADYRASHPS